MRGISTLHRGFARRFVLDLQPYRLSERDCKHNPPSNSEGKGRVDSIARVNSAMTAARKGTERGITKNLFREDNPDGKEQSPIEKFEYQNWKSTWHFNMAQLLNDGDRQNSPGRLVLAGLREDKLHRRL